MRRNDIEMKSCSSMRDYMSLEPDMVNKYSFEKYLRETAQYSTFKMLSWYGSYTLKDVEAICKGGWTEGLKVYENVKKALPEIEVVGEFHKKYKRKKKFSDSGDEVDIDKYIHGEFDLMFIDYDKHIQDKEGKIITIYTSLGFNSRYSSTEAIWNGIASVVLTDIFESVGYRVHLIGFIAGLGRFVNPGDPNKTQIDIDIKLPNQSLDILGIVTATAYPGFFRYYGFKALYSFPYRLWSHLGLSIQSPHVYNHNSFVIGDIWDNTMAHLKIMEVLNTVKKRNLA